MFPEDTKMWVSNVAPVGALRKWLEADKRSPLPFYVAEEVASQVFYPHPH
jgi:hypothetical protein